MAEIPTQEEIIRLAEPEQTRLDYKRFVTRSPEWQPKGDDHGAGILPEDIWRDSSPESKAETSIPRTLDGRILGGENNG